jgi:acetylornithine deacetylase/succinyl-diaminopimelate desuccinylase-like protein
MSSEIIENIIQRIIEIQQIPSPTFHEEKRAKFIRQQFRAEGLKDVSMDELCNVYARLPGESSAASLVVSAHLDTVFPSDTDLEVIKKPGQVAGPGIGDNSSGLAGLFGLLWSLKRDNISLPGDIWLVANVGEEGLGDLQGMKKVVDRFGDKPLAYIVLEGLVYGRVFHRGLGVRRYRVTFSTPGGHSWVDYGAPSAIHELASFVTRLVSLKLPKKPRTTMNIGKFSGGISVNSIASEASLDLDLRSGGQEQLDGLDEKVKNLIQSFNRPGVETTCELIGAREMGGLDTDHPLVTLAVRVLENQGKTPELNIGSTDANVPLSREIPAICIGVTNGGYGHTTNEFIFTEPLADGISQIVEVVRGAFDVGE